jgi:putative membrane protein
MLYRSGFGASKAVAQGAAGTALIGLVTLAPLAANAEDGAEGPATVLSSWDLSPAVVAPAALVMLVFALGLRRRPTEGAERPWRTLAFIWGVIATFLSLASPLDAMADHSFTAHQVQHMLLRMIGPMLVTIGQPQAVLMAGLPTSIRRGVLLPLLVLRPLRQTFAFLTRPTVATVLFVASLYVWQWPALHNLAILNEDVHDAMHLTMLLAGLLFFGRVFDRRPPPKGAPYGVRLMMLWVGALSNIPIGAYAAFKGRELYPAYDVAGRLFHLAPMTDERLGGFIMWAPATMMMLFAVLLVINDWSADESTRADRHPSARPTPEQLAPKNRALAFGLAAFAGCLLAATFAVGIMATQHGAPVSAVADAHLPSLKSSFH